MTNDIKFLKAQPLERRYKEIETVRQTFEQVQTEIEALIDEPEAEIYRTEFEEKFYDTYRIATNLLASEHPQSSTPTINQPIIQTETNQTVRNDLPIIGLPKFDGAYDAWLGFHDLFNCLIHEDPSIAPIRKLFYLKGCLEGEAASVIAFIELSANNYEVAWQLLRERFDNRKLIREKYIKGLIDLPNLTKDLPIRAFLDDLQKYIRALKALGEPVESWNSILIVLIREKFNSFIRERWEECTNDTPNPTTEKMIAFLTKRAQLENAEAQSYLSKPTNNVDKFNSSKSRFKSKHQQVYSASVSNALCIHCAENHYITSCKKFEALSPIERYEIAKTNSWCINCLRKGHRSSQCTSSNCRNCHQKHHTLLHFDNKRNDTLSSEIQKNIASQPRSSVNLHARVTSEALLATAIVELKSHQMKSKICRVLLDAGSQAHFITEATAKFLNLEKKSVDIAVTGLDSTSTVIKHATSAILKSRFSNFQKNVEFLIVPQISKITPSIPINHEALEIPKNIVLADPKFFEPATIDALIGVKLFYKLLSIGQITLKNHPDAILQKTQLGWIVAGEINNTFNSSVSSFHITTSMHSLDESVQKFWEIEEIPLVKALSAEERACENHFTLHTRRNSNGRYIVRLPFNNKRDKLGNSYKSALRRFYGLENRLNKDESLKKEYIKFLVEYEQLEHMSISNQEIDQSQFYLPHHAVVKQDSVTSKIRVVFDGSAKTSSGISLNDTLMVGPKLQEDLFAILTRFRSHQYVLTADIEKMYRQIQIHSDDANYQKILFRKHPQESIKEYTLNTVTYGTACASFLSIRALHQLADDEGGPFPLAATVLKRDFHVDDPLTGTNSLHEAEILRDNLLELLKKGGFMLRKWASNDRALIANYHENPESNHMSLDLDAPIKTLGIQWNSKQDKLFYQVKIDSSIGNTKRTILSQISKLFDPLGLLGPVILHAKLIMQLLWMAGISWDESIPLHIHTLWSSYKEQLPLIEDLRLERYVLCFGASSIQLHGFCDASERAYGACIYIRTVDESEKITVKLVCSKSRVAPIKSVSLPRLELCGALLLARLYASVKKALLISFDEIHLWSDSTITFHWINTSPHKLKTFVANRVAEIQDIATNCCWHHVPTKDNPADAISRGQTPSEFVHNSIWSHGPSFLYTMKSSWPKGIPICETLPDLKANHHSLLNCMKLEINKYDILERYSSLSKLRRVIAYICRFTHNARKKDIGKAGELDINELESANHVIIRLVQCDAFAQEIRALQNNKPIQYSSKLVPLTPFLDNNGLLRVGGRLSRASLPNEQLHPVLLPAYHHITKIIIREEHLRLNHAGAQVTLYSVHLNHWPLSGRKTTRKVINQCLPCYRAKPRLANHTEGALPEYRVTPSRPFLRVGVDYCGALYIKEKHFRNRNKLKLYVAIYVCMSTKAVHIELVSDLTTEAFMASLKRFFSRRGKSAEIFSDNATNFVGAKRELSELYTLIASTEHNQIIKTYLANERIIWHFIPPRSPHFGGLWEAAVKSFKNHLTRTVGDAVLTYEQLETYIIEIEAILNSRPISPLSEDPNDLLPLTPGHFLIGGPLTSFPQEDITDIQPSRLSAWQHAQQLKQHFWKRWTKEYLHNLISSNNRVSKNANLTVGQLVIIQEDNLPPLQWNLGRIIEVHPGADNIVRVVTLKTNKGIYKRFVKRLCLLPIEQDNQG